ncbi:MAG: DUF1549 and DUF1553 domain-containing protein [Verrucomicrobiota bacterium]
MRTPAPVRISFVFSCLLLGTTAAEYDFELGDQEYLFREAETHWSFQPLERPVPPTVKSDWPRNPIDRFIFSKLQESGMSPAKEASAETLVRLLFFDLIGLPPSPAEMDRWTKDWSEKKYRALVNHLLASPHYGERWGRHWLDVARYADTRGWLAAGREQRYPFAFTYRDWVVKALNEDMPFDEFCRLQIAADKMVGDDETRKDDLAALGFLTAGGRFLNRKDSIIDDRIDVVTRGMMGLTVTCARCHDHMFDPIPTADYYSLYGVFASTTEPKELPPIVDPDDMTEEQLEAEAKLAEMKTELTNFKDEVARKLRGPEKIAAHLEFSVRMKSLNRAKTISEALKASVFLKVAERWGRYLAAAQKSNDNLWSAWHAMAPHLVKGESGKAAAAFKKLSSANPAPPRRLLDLIAWVEPANLKELASIYADLIAETDATKPHPDATTEALRLVLNDPKGPLANITGNNIENFWDRKVSGSYRKLVIKFEGAVVDMPTIAPRAMVLEDMDKPFTPVIFERGDPSRRGDKVPRQFLTVLEDGKPEPFTNGSGRMELSEKITDPENPLTARVKINRVWMHHFGKPLVDTPSDFGLQAPEPVHRELLDWLATEFIRRDWSLKELHRLMIFSSTYRQETIGAEGAEKDPENRLWGRMESRRLEYEAMRDAVLAVTGELDRTLGGRPEELDGENATLRRAIYGHINRARPATSMLTFDVADPSLHAPRRAETTVPQQALFFMNSPFVQERVANLNALTKVKNPQQRIKKIYRRVFSRFPESHEIDAALAFVGDNEEKWEDLIQALIASNEFAFVD